MQDQRVRELAEAFEKVEAAGLPPQFALYVAGFGATVSADQISQYYADDGETETDMTGDAAETPEEATV